MTVGRAAALGCALGALASGAGCSLVLNFDDPVIDAVPIVIDSDVDAREGLDAAPDPFEPNDTPLQAAPIDPGTYNSLTIVPNTDVDYYSFATPGAADITIDVLFVDAIGDIDIRLFNSTSTTEVASSKGEVDNEHITLTGAMQPPAGTYYLNVYSANQSNVYDLSLQVVGGPPPDAAPTTDGGP